MPDTDNDPSASTASFRAFAQRSDDMASSGGARSNRAIIIAAVAVVVAIVAIVVALSV
jgi:hypothetical protein